MLKYIIAIIFGYILSTQAWSWQGFNMDNGTVILIQTEEQQQVKMGNVTYFDYDSGEEKEGYLNMYDQNIGLLLDLNSGDLIRVRMDELQARN
ncbi:MAG: hypothetical protein AAGB35_08090 [Pseudomonadota bacterium]